MLWVFPEQGMMLKEFRMDKSEVLEGLMQGRTLNCDRKDEPLLPWLLSLVVDGVLTSELVELDEQSSVLKFRKAVADS